MKCIGLWLGLVRGLLHCVAAVLLLAHGCVLAQTFTCTAPSGQVLRCVVVDGAVEVSKQPGIALAGPLVIPDSVAYGGVGYRVERVGSFASSGVTSVVVPGSVRRIADGAFRNCTALAAAALGDSVRVIGRYAFYHCVALGGVVLPPVVDTIGDYAFAECRAMDGALVIPDSTRRVGLYAFNQCRRLDTVCVGSGVTVVEDECFAYCDSLSLLELGEGVDSLGRGAFFGCGKLRSVLLPAGLKAIGYGSFEGCGQLREVVVPDSVRTLGAYAFSQCRALGRIGVGLGVRQVGRYAFNRCVSLDSFFFHSPVPPAIEDNAFGNTSPDKVFMVPCGAEAAYRQLWGDAYRYAEPEAGVSLTVGVDDTAHGWAEAPWGVRCDSVAEVRATARRGYRFAEWSNGRRANPDTLWLTGDSAVTAHFEPMVYELRVETNNGEWGSATGGGDYAFGTEVTIAATAFEGYGFVGWNDGSAANPRRVVVESDTLFTAMFGPLGAVDEREKAEAPRVYAERSDGGWAIVIEGAVGRPVEVADRMGRSVMRTTNGAGRLRVPVGDGGVYVVRVGRGDGVVVSLPAVCR